MKPQVTQSSLLRDMREAWRESKALIGELDEADLTRAGAEGDWSVKDVLAHLAGYERLYVESAEAHIRGEPQHMDKVRALSPEERNQNDVLQSRQRTLKEVVSDERDAFQLLMAQVESFSDVFVVEPQKFEGLDEPVVVGRALQHVCDHRRAHFRSLRAWRTALSGSTKS